MPYEHEAGEIRDVLRFGFTRFDRFLNDYTTIFLQMALGFPGSGVRGTTGGGGRGGEGERRPAVRFEVCAAIRTLKTGPTVPDSPGNE